MRRTKRLRKTAQLRELVRENHLRIETLVYPLFLVEGEHIKEEIPSLPEVYHFSLDQLEDEIQELIGLGIEKVLLFGVPDNKNALGTEAYNQQGIVQQGIRKIKALAPSMMVITDICLCQFTDHGHCGILMADGQINNDETLDYLSQIAISHGEAGADMVAPSDMMDGRIAQIRKALDAHGFKELPIMAYSAKYASNYYGPFRDAAHSTPSFGDRKSYQMDFANRREALLEVEIDIEEGADIVMVKPALAYLDIIREIRNKFNHPIAAYNVSGEYAMLKYAVKEGMMHEEVIEETLLAIKRAGADIIITYFAKYIAKKLKEQ